MPYAYLFLLIGLTFSFSAEAELYKCTGNAGRATYQAQPCQSGKESAVDIKIKDPERDAEHQAKFKALESEVAEKRRQAEAQEASQKKQPTMIVAPANALTR